jgi:hypothetical protein
MSIAASKKLWRISKEANGFYYEIKLDGIVIDRIKVEEPVLKILKERNGI